MDNEVRPTDWREFLAVFAVASAIALALGMPVLLDPAERMVGSEIVARSQDPFYMVSLFEDPPPQSIRTQPMADYPGVLLAWVFGSGVIAYNLLMLATFPLAALAAFALARFLTGSPGVGWIAGLFYAFSPFAIAHVAYHPHIAQTQWIPLFFLALWASLQESRFAHGAAIVASAGFVALSNFYNGFIVIVLTPIALVAYWLLVRRRQADVTTRPLLCTIAALVVAALLGLVYVLLQAPAALSDPRSLAWPYSDLTLYSARWYSYLVPPVGHPLLASWVAEFWEGWSINNALVEQQLTLGAGLLALACVALLGWVTRPREPLLRSVPVLALLGSTAFVCSLSPVWQVGDRGIPRPTALFYIVAPMFRAHSRFGLVVFLCVAILGATGFVLLVRSRSRLASALAILALGAALLELTPMPPWRWRDVLPTAAHRWLHDSPAPEGGSPIRVGDCLGYRERAELSIPDLFRHELWVAGSEVDCGQPSLAGVLAAQGTTHLIVRTGGDLDRWLSSPGRFPGLERRRAFADATVYGVDRPRPEAYLEIGEGFHGREYQGEISFRWMRARGDLWLINDSGSATRVEIGLVLHAFPGRRSIQISLDDEPVADVEVGTSPSLYRLPQIEIGPGRHRLGLQALEPAVSPAEVLGTSDRRRLTVALGDWRLAD